MRITDKQRIDFVQRHAALLNQSGIFKKIGKEWGCLVCLPNRFTINVSAPTWRQAVDKASKAYMRGKK